MNFNFTRTGQALLDAIFKQLAVVLRRLSFTENFRCFEWSGDIDPGAEISIAHPLGVTPRGWLVVDRSGGEVERGSEPWSSQFVSLRNQSSIATNVKVIFLAEI